MRSAGRCCRLHGQSIIGEHERLLRLRDPGHRGLGEKRATIRLRFHLLLQQLTAYQQSDGGGVAEEADPIDVAF